MTRVFRLLAALALVSACGGDEPMVQAAPIEAPSPFRYPVSLWDKGVQGETLLQVHVSDAIEGYVVDLVTATRESRRLAVGASPRGSIALLKLSRAKAALAGRDFVTPEDVKAIAVPALAHRLTVKPELWVQRLRGEDVVAEALETVPTPPAEDAVRAAAEA